MFLAEEHPTCDKQRGLSIENLNPFLPPYIYGLQKGGGSC